VVLRVLLYCLGGDGSGGNNFVAIIAVASLHSLVIIVQKEEKEQLTKRDK
jgi:hypothetical protein